MATLKLWRSFEVSGFNSSIPVHDLFTTFESFGSLSHLDIQQDGLVHVGYYKNRDAEHAFGILHDSLVLGYLVELKWIDDDVRDPIRTFLIRNISEDVNDEGLEALFLPYGILLCCVTNRDDQGNSLGTGVVHYKECIVEDVLFNLNNVEVNDVKLQVEFLKPPTQDVFCFKSGSDGVSIAYLYANNINKNVSEYQIYCEFQAFGYLKYVQVQYREDQQCVYIFYESTKDVVNAVNLMAERMNKQNVRNISVVNKFVEPAHFSQITAVAILVKGKHGPEVDMSWKLSWPLEITPTFDPTTKWNIYQINFQ